MLSEPQRIDFSPIEIPKVRRGPMGLVKIVAALCAIMGAAWAWHAGYRPPQLFAETKAPLRLVDIDQGDIEVFVVENGTVESANNRTVRCKVEALIGLVGGAQSTTGTTAGTTSGSSGQGSGSGGYGASGTQGASGASGQAGATGQDAAKTKSKSKSKTKKKAGSSSTSSSSSVAGSGSSSGSGASSSSSGASSSGTSSGGSSSMAGSGGSGSSGGTSASGSTTTTTSTPGSGKPVIRSFTIEVIAHTPQRPVTTKAADTGATKKQAQGKMAGGGGGRGRGGRGRGANPLDEEKPGSTRIVEIVPEGQKVKAGDVVCRLDSSAYEDEKKAQLIRYLQAKAYVDQARSILSVAQISQSEYRDGIYPQDVQLIRQYIETCQLERDRLERNLAWSSELRKKGFRTSLQVKGDTYAFEQAEIALSEAKGMLERLIKQTGPKIKTALQANVWAIEADKRTQEASFSLEEQRLKRIENNIANCTVRAPDDGIVVYANLANPWGMVEQAIDQGVTLRQDQPIFNLPDPKHMRVKAKINESKVALVQPGQTVTIVVDAYTDHPLRGKVAEVTPISVPIRGSDVRIYYANVDILEGFDDLRPGLSAEIKVEVERRRQVTRVPVDCIRWSGEQAYVALHDSSLEAAGKEPWHWQLIEIGLSDTNYAEVTQGLKVGDRVVANPIGLQAPRPSPPSPPATEVAIAASPR
jgi:multidrug resistance efflux pump